MSGFNEDEAREWFMGTPGMFVCDLVERYGIKKAHAQSLVGKWARENRPPPKEKKETAKSLYWKIAKTHGDDLRAEYAASGSKLKYETWRIMKTRAIRDAELAKLK